MRYNTYRQYKTLSGYNSRTPSSLTYVERNYKFEWKTYDFIKSMPSDLFNRLFVNSGDRLNFTIGPDGFIRSIVRTNSYGKNPIEVPFEPNSYFQYITDPDGDEDSTKDLYLIAYDSNGNQLTLYRSGGNSPYLENYSLSWTNLPPFNNLPDKDVTAFISTDGTPNNTQLYWAYNVDHFVINYKIDSNDTQESIKPFIFRTPTFVPNE